MYFGGSFIIIFAVQELSVYMNLPLFVFHKFIIYVIKRILFKNKNKIIQEMLYKFLEESV